MINYRNIYIIIILLFFIDLKAQDPSFSQLYFNKLYFNPAFAGISNGLEFSLSERLLWPNLPGKFNTFKFSGDIDVSIINGVGGVGLLAVSDVEGEGYLKTTTVGIPISFRPMNFTNSVNAARPKHFNFQSGFLFAIIHKSINWENFIFSDQFDNVKGIVRPSSFIVPVESSIVFPDISFGFVAEYLNSPFSRSHRKQWSLRGGAAFHHLTQPDFNFTGSDSKLPIKQTWHLNFNFPLRFDNDFIVAPAVNYEKQAGMQTYSLGSNVLWKFPFVGASYRHYYNFDAIAVTSGLRIGNDNLSIISYTYDFTISGLMRGTGGSHEININYIIETSDLSITRDRKGRKRVNMITCPFF